MSNKLRICTEYAVRTLLLHCIEISKKSKNNCKRVHQIICVYIYTRVWCEHFTPNECSCRASSSAVCFVIKTQLNRSSRPRRAHLLGVVLLRLFACFKSALCSRFRCHHRTLWIFQVHRVKTVVTTCESQANRKPLHHTAAENEMFIHRLNTTPVLIQRSIWTQTRAHTASQLFFSPDNFVIILWYTENLLLEADNHCGPFVDRVVCAVCCLISSNNSLLFAALFLQSARAPKGEPKPNECDPKSNIKSLKNGQIPISKDLSECDLSIVWCDVFLYNCL